MIAPLILLCLVAVSHQISITEFEVPYSVHEGENVDLKCKYQLDAGESEEDVIVKWWRKTLEEFVDDRVQLYQQIGNSKPPFLRHNLVIKSIDTITLVNATPADTGIYECEVSSIEEVRKYQPLYVCTEGRDLELNVTEVEDGPDEDEEQDALIECRASDVAPLPDFMLSVNGEPVSLRLHIDGPDQDGLYDIVGNTTVSRDLVEGADVRCELIYMNSNITHRPYVVTYLYDPFGALTTTEAPEYTTWNEATTDSIQDPSDNASNIQISWFLLLIAGLLLLNV